MNPNQLTCDPVRVELFLQQQLSEREQLAFESHLDKCSNCQQELEKNAASENFVSDMRASLLAAPISPAPLETSPAPAGSEEEDSFHTGPILDLLAPTDDDRMLGRLGPYEIVGIVGSGGMGVVLKAFDAPLNRYVAIKLLSPHLASSGPARKRFSREAQAAAAVVHENVIEVHSVAGANGLPYLVMPYVRGPSLQKRLCDNGPLAVPEVLRIGMQAAAGLAAAHAQGLVHRDVKPANIMLSDGVERVKLTDFGLARAVDDASLTRTGVIAGTPQYMSPEQARGEAVETRSDLFSLGSVLYALCTGRPPFRAETTFGILRRITDEMPRPIREINPDIPDWLCGIIEKLMSKEPASRYTSASEVAALLESCLAHVQHPIAVPLPTEAARQPRSRSWYSFPLAGVVTVIAFILVGALGICGWQATQPYEIGGRWQGEGWGDVTLTKVAAGDYRGTYNDTFGKQPGAIVLTWSRLENQYKGTWREGKDRFGKISLRKYESEIRGAWTTNKHARINGGTPELSDLTWKRPRRPAPGNKVMHRPNGIDVVGEVDPRSVQDTRARVINQKIRIRELTAQVKSAQNNRDKLGRMFKSDHKQVVNADLRFQHARKQLQAVIAGSRAMENELNALSAKPGRTQRDAGLETVIIHALAIIRNRSEKSIRKISPAYRSEWKDDIERIRACRGIERLSIATLKQAEDHVQVITSPVTSEAGRQLVLELYFVKQKDSSWMLRHVDIEPAGKPLHNPPGDDISTSKF